MYLNLVIFKIGANVNIDCLANGKHSIALNLKHASGINILKRLSVQSDVLIEPFRKGVMESLGVGPNILMKDNPRLIYVRLTGYGQNGYYSSRAGHDINYLSLSGLLSLFGRHNENPTPPINIAADFGGGGLVCALGIMLALLERQNSGKGQVVDCSMVEGSAYLGSWLYRSQNLPIWGNPRGENPLDSGSHFYETYKTKDGKFMAVGAIEPQFYSQLIKGLDLQTDQVPQFGEFDASKKIFASKFLEKTQAEWCKIFDKVDACVTPILSLEEAPQHQHNVEREAYIKNFKEQRFVPNPAPKLSRTPGQSQSCKPPPSRGQHTKPILTSLGYTDEEILQLEKLEVVELFKSSKL